MKRSESTILIVDDACFPVDRLVDLLKDEYSIAVVKEGRQALCSARGSAPPDLMLLPVRDGRLLCRQLKQDPATCAIPVILLVTGGALEEDGDGAPDPGADDYIFAPVSPVVVRARVRTHLALRQLRKALRRLRRELERTAASSEAHAQHAGRNRLSTIYNANPDCIRIIDANGIILDMNPTGVAMLEAASLDEIKGRCIYDFVDAGQRDEFIEMNRRVFAGAAVSLEFMAWTLKGNRLWMEANSVPLFDGDGHVIENLSITRNITRRKEIEEALRKLSTAVEQGPASIIITDKRGAIEYVNPEFERVTGYSQQEVVGRNPRILKSGRIAPEIYADLWKTIARGDIWRGELHNRKKDGSLYWELASICPIKNDAGEVTHFIAIKENISLLKLREDELRAAKEMADAASRSKSEFLANLSHEIRTPMNAIIGMGHLLQNTGPTEEQQGYLSAIQSSSRHLLSIINDILDFSKIEAGKLEMQSTEFHLNDVLKDISNLIAPLVEESALGFQISAPEVSHLLVGDPLRLGQVLINLINNALKFTDQGEVRVSVGVLEQECDWIRLRFAIRDTGMGIEPEQQPRLFQPFTQVDNTPSRWHNGTGLGLAISRQLVERMGGKIWLESEPGKGSTFFFTARFGLVAAGERALPEPAVSSPLSRSKRPRVLLVEDDRLNQIVAQRLLESYGVQVVLAANGREAVEAVKRHPFDLVLMDLQMPELDGYQATAEIRRDERFQALPIIAMTAHTLVGERERCLAAGMNDHFPKPFEPGELMQLLEKWISA